jgi:hypothetical protein
VDTSPPLTDVLPVDTSPPLTDVLPVDTSPYLTDVLAVVFIFLSLASADSCCQFVNDIFRCVSLSRPRTVVSQGAIGTQNK